MITITIPEFDMTIQCDEWSYRSTAQYYGGYVLHPPEINITATFKEGRDNEIFHRIAISGRIIDEILVNCIEDAPPVAFGYVVIVKEESLSMGFWRIHMKALRISYNGATMPTKRRLCKCGRNIEYWHVKNLMIKVGITDDMFGQIWDNDLFKFMCCMCYKKKNSSHSEYINVTWEGEPPREVVWECPRQDYLGDIDEEYGEGS